MLKAFSKLFVYPVCLSFLLPSLALADISITEVMYDVSGSDTGREWVEFKNTGSSEVTITAGGTNAAWRFSDGSQHTLTLISGSLTLAAGAFAVIADNATTFLTDWPSFSGTASC